MTLYQQLIDASKGLRSRPSLRGNVSVLLGNGEGTFQAAQNFGTDDGPLSVAVGDFNADAELDLATASFSGEDVSVLLDQPP